MKTTFMITLCTLTYHFPAMCMEQASTTSHMIPLFAALENKKSEQVQKIITEFPQAINMHHKYTNDSRILFGDVTPLHVAVYKDDKQTVQLLLAAGADCNAQTQGLCRKDAPLHLVKSSEIATFLIQHKASVHAKNRFEWTPLYAALFHSNRRHNIEVAESLVLAGANVNQFDEKSSFKETLLHEAVKRREGVIDIVRFLLKYGAHKKAIDARGKTPFDYAIHYHNGWQELINLLK